MDISQILSVSKPDLAPYESIYKNLHSHPGLSLQEHKAAETAASHLLQQAFGDRTDSPLIRAHNLSPLAPQPARVSPLATAREPPVLRDLPADEAPPAQVAALRQKPSGFSSTDSSPKGVKESGKKKGKKEKRKRKRREIEECKRSR